MRKQALLFGITALILSSFSISGCGRQEKEDEYEGDKLKVSVRNLYFSTYAGGDDYLNYVENKFGLTFEFSSYSWGDWNTQINGAINADDMTDIFHANITSYNFANLYKFWAEEEMAKPLPDNLSKWPNIKRLIDNTSNIDSLKLNGKLYGIPIAQNTTDFTTTFSPFTYLYRRDWAKKWDVYQENDEYTWDQFITLLEKFRDELAPSNKYALGDVKWGFPSIPNFYKQVPHCFAQDETGKYVNNYKTDAYIEGLEMSKSFFDNGYYYPDENSASDDIMQKKYTDSQIGIYYENLSYSNFYTIKNLLIGNNVSRADFNIDDATAILKVRGEDGKYHLEGTDNWFSMTFFDYKISDAKQEKLLDLMDWLLSEEGTIFSVYGFENIDYIKDGGQIKLVETSWDKKKDGSYAPKPNGARYLRYMASLGYDLLKMDPLSDPAAVAYLESWDQEMKEAYANGELVVLKENKDVMWLTTPLRSAEAGGMRTLALDNVIRYIYGQVSLDDYKNSFGSIWDRVLAEINNALGK